jgi:alanine racemase
MTRPTGARIDRAALRHNLGVARRAARGARVLAVVKADAYGHGVDDVVDALSGADAFGVACVEEALAVRARCRERPVVLLEGFFHPAELDPILRHRLDVVVHRHDQVEALAHLDPPHPVTVWLKVDSGMHRLGFPPEEVPAVWRRLSASRGVAAPVHLMTHLACADTPRHLANAAQMERFAGAIAGLPGPVSIANSAALLGIDTARRDWVRPGIMLYGASPLEAVPAADLGLAPVMTLESALISVKRCAAGGAVGYGATWVAPEDMPLGVAAIGYGDGYPRHAPSGTPVLVKGHRATLVGRVSMDMITLDLRGVPDPRPGDPVVLWGEGLPVDDIARAAGTIPYELLCGVTPRVPKRLTEKGDGGIKD